jgi:type II secretory pathway component GspD/PulD (secretin)
MKNNISGESDSTSTGSSSSGSSSSGSSSDSEDKGKWKVDDDSGITLSVRKLLSPNGTVIEDFRTNSLIVTDIPSRMEVIRKVISSLDISVPQVMLEVEVLDVSKNIVDNIGFKFGQTPFSVAITGASASMGFPYHNWTKIFNGADGSININNASTDGGSYKAQLDFLRTQTDTKYLARPKILTLNNETAEIKIVTNEAIGVNAVQEGVGSSSNTTSSAERYETGVTLRVTPQIDLASGEITMFVFPKVSEASTTTSTFTSGGQSYTFLNPEVRSTKTTVRIQNGETVVLGGLIRNQNSIVITKLPFLGDIPFFGALFRHKNVSPGKDRELLVFITPRIIKDSGSIETKAQGVQQAKKMMLPPREQSTVSVINRQSSINTYLNTLDKQR